MYVEQFWKYNNIIWINNCICVCLLYRVSNEIWEYKSESLATQIMEEKGADLTAVPLWIAHGHMYTLLVCLSVWPQERFMDDQNFKN